MKNKVLGKLEGLVKKAGGEVLSAAQLKKIPEKHAGKKIYIASASTDVDAASTKLNKALASQNDIYQISPSSIQIAILTNALFSNALEVNITSKNKAVHTPATEGRKARKTRKPTTPVGFHESVTVGESKDVFPSREDEVLSPSASREDEVLSSSLSQDDEVVLPTPARKRRKVTKEKYSPPKERKATKERKGEKEEWELESKSLESTEGTSYTSEQLPVESSAESVGAPVRDLAVMDQWTSVQSNTNPKPPAGKSR